MSDPILSDYINRTYPGVENPKLTDFDEKMVATIRRVKAKYAEHERSFTVLVSREEGYRLQTKTTAILAQPVEKTQNSTPVVQQLTCQAIKMDGCICGAKLKNGNEYCGRHTKKA
tara:strand:+ start:1528 stop:1872 length:345 start_codon:yes stop_codon:yes gene_type:complete